MNENEAKKLVFDSSNSMSEKSSSKFDSNKDIPEPILNIAQKQEIYPFEDISFFPIISKENKELFFLHFSEVDLNFFINERREYFKYPFDKNDKLFESLSKDIFIHFKTLYKNVSLEERLRISCSEKMSNIKPNYSFALEMNEQLKNRQFVQSQINDYVFIKKDIMKNLGLDKKDFFSDTPFPIFRLNSVQNTNKKLFPKYAKSIHDKEQDSSDDEDVVEYRESLISHLDDEPVKSYKDILKQLFKMTDLRKDLINYCLDKDEKFENNDFEKFVCYLEYFITLFTGIQVKYSIDELGLLNMDFYASENTFMKMAEILHYVTQFQIRDRSYYKGKKGKSKKTIIDLNNEQYENYDFDKLEYFPVYTTFMISLKNNFRRYDKNDCYHLCEKCSNLQNQNTPIECDSSLFRFIDKTRLLYMTLIPILKIGYIEKMIKSKNNHINQIFKSSMFLRNEYVLNSLNDKYIIKSYLSPKQTPDTRKIDNVFKNTFGETLGYFFVWISHYLTWLIFPTIIGLIFEILSFLISDKTYTYFNLIFLSIIILWGLYYTEDWNCWQIFYNNIWGIYGYISEKSNLYAENYDKVSHIIFLGVKMEKIDNFQKFKNIFISTISLSFFTGIIIFTNIAVFYLYKLKNLQKVFIINYRYQVPILILIIRELLSKLIYKITKTLAHLENPTDKDKYLEIVTRKRLILEYINYYFNLYYIAFYHRLAGKCTYENCLSELKTQLLMLLIVDSIFVLGKLLYKSFYLRKTKKSFETTLMKKYNKSDVINDPQSTSIKFKIYTREEFSEENTQKIILPVIFHFGYVIQFGACFPISFLFLFILTIFCRITDALSMVNLFYVKTIEASKGLKGYNRMQTRMLFIGVFTNIGIICYTKGKTFLEKDAIKALIIIIIIENGIFLFFKIFNFEHFPFWFRYKGNIKLRYLKKFGVAHRNKGDKFNDYNLKNENKNKK